MNPDFKFTGELVHDLLISAAANHPNNTAFVMGKKTITYEEVNLQSNLMANSLHKILDLENVNKQSDVPICVSAENSFEYAELFYAANKMGCPLIPLNPLLCEEEFCALIKKANAKLVFIDHKHKPAIEHILNQLPSVVKVIIMKHFDKKLEKHNEEQLIQENNNMMMTFQQFLNMGNTENVSLKDLKLLKHNFELTDQSISIMPCTSGTTSLPNLTIAQHIVFTGFLKVKPTRNADTFVITNFAGSVTPAMLARQCSVGRAVEFVDQAVIDVTTPFKQMTDSINDKTKEVEFVMVFADVLKWLIDCYEQNNQFFVNSNLKEIIYGGMKMPIKTIEKFRSIFPNAEISQIYGSTEMGLVAILDNDEHNNTDKNSAFKKGSCGKVLPWVQLRIVDPKTKEVLKTNEIGEIQVKGQFCLPVGYFNAEANDKAKDDAGWFFSGDMARIDENNYLYVLDRVKEIIILPNARNVYNSEVEGVIIQHPRVKEVLSFGILHEDELGEYIGVALRLYDDNHNHNHDETSKTNILLDIENDAGVVPDVIKDIAKHCEKHLSSYKIPHKYVIMDEFPRSINFKISRKSLQARFSLVDQKVALGA